MKKAFTLAETLITLAIIGVVAAITLLVIQQNSFDAQQKTLYKKAFYTLSNATNKLRADLGYQMGCHYDSNGSYATGDFSECAEFFNQFALELNVAKSCIGNAYSNGCISDIRGIDTVVPASGSSGCGHFNESYIKNTSTVYVLQDGMIIIPYVGASIFAVDINGKTLPNKWGYDIFSFAIWGDTDSVKLNGTTTGCLSPETGGKTNSQMIQYAFK